MGMDVYGDNPSAEGGRYFRNNVWWWRPLWDYCRLAAPGLTAGISGHTNDGDGLNASDSLVLADILQEQIDSGETLRYQQAYEAELNAMPNVKCTYCDGTGIRTDNVGVANGMLERVVPNDKDNPRAGQIGYCNACNGKGYERPMETNYPFSVKNVQEFVNFLNACGGFKIC